MVNKKYIYRGMCMKIISLNTDTTTYQMGVNDQGFLLHLYYGPKLDCDMSNALAYYVRGMSGVPYDCRESGNFSCDVMPMEMPCWGNGDYRSPAMSIRDSVGISALDLRYVSHKFLQGKDKIPGLPSAYGTNQVECCQILLTDYSLELDVILCFGIFKKENVITKNILLKNNSSSSIFINKCLTATLDFIDGSFDLIHFHGRHMMERIPERVSVSHSMEKIGSRRGISSHQENPFVILADKTANENSGLCYGMSFMYSGNFSVEAQRDQFEQTRLQMGLLDERLDYELLPKESFYTPEVIMACSADGFNQLSQIYHHFIRNNVCRGKYKNSPRPILINNWEATYFDFTGDKIIAIAKQAKALGIEMMVLDDGWFGSRNSDMAGLGDWQVNETKLGCSMKKMVDSINDIGLKFGLWIEPEMVNEDSDLYRNHPDYAFVIKGRKPVLGRNQLVLDFSRKEVVDCIFGQICQVLDSANIEYIKMDMNRCISDVCTSLDGNQNYGTIVHNYVLGVYNFLDRLLERYPNLLIEGCSSGGGRFDAGMLYYTPQIWCSDNTDPIERLTIQNGTSFGYPVSAVSAHVSASPNHQTGRVTDIATRGIVAMSGNLGYELDLTAISESEKNEIINQIQTYKNDWNTIHNGKYFRHESDDLNKGYISWNFVSKEQESAIINVVDIATHANRPVYYAKCLGLLDKAIYICLENDKEYSGAALRYIGIPVPIEAKEYGAFQFHLHIKE